MRFLDVICHFITYPMRGMMRYFHPDNAEMLQRHYKFSFIHEDEVDDGDV